MKQVVLFVLCCLYLTTQSCQDNDIVNPVLEISEETVLFKQNESKREIAVKATQKWSAKVDVSAKEWCSIVLTENTIEISVTENSGAQTRIAQISVISGDLNNTIEVKQMGSEPTIELSDKRVDLAYDITEYELNVIANIEYDVVIDEKEDWISLISQNTNTRTLETTCKFALTKNQSTEKRFTDILFKQRGGDFETSVLVTQLPRDKDYTPGDSEGLGDIKLKVARGIASQAQSGEGIERSFDDDMSTIYHSPYTGSGTKLPVTLTYYFDKAEKLDYVIYKPRTDGSNGVWGTYEIQVARNSSDVFETIKNDGDFQLGTTSKRVDFESQVTDITAVRFIVKSGHNNFVSCAEMEFYQSGNAIEGLLDIFTDELCTELKPEVTQAHIDAFKDPFFKPIAQSMLDGTYQKEFRIQTYKPYRTINSLSKELKISGYNPFENPTGIYFDQGETVLLVGNTQQENVELQIHNFNAPQTDEIYLLNPGINKINVQKPGLGYVKFYTDNYQSRQPVCIHIAGGKVNGYFDKSKHSSAEWKTLLGNSVHNYFDIIGEHVNLAYRVGDLERYCNDGMKLITNYDKIVDVEHEVMGLTKYNRRPENKMFARTVESGLFADGWGAGFAKDVMDKLANPDRMLKEGTWTIAHEFGHVNQIRPGLKWVSTSEVTNNVYSVVVRYTFTPDNLNLEHERVNDGDNNNVLGGRFNSYLNYGIVKGEQWLCQKGQDKMTDYQNGGDHFVKLCPLWQLMLYYRMADGAEWLVPDWYADVAEIVRKTDESKLSNGQLQLNFMRNVCDVVQTDLTDFFERIGMLKPIDKFMDDYSKAQLTITESDCQNLRASIKSKGYKQPASPVIYYLTANSLDAFRYKRPVTGIYNQGVAMQSDYCILSHSVWKNVTVFETYAGPTLTKVAMVGTDSPDRSTTLVRYPSGSTSIYAVAWDGTRTLVYGTSNGIEKTSRK